VLWSLQGLSPLPFSNPTRKKQKLFNLLCELLFLLIEEETFTASCGTQKASFHSVGTRNLSTVLLSALSLPLLLQPTPLIYFWKVFIEK
jgi:hypothetical protein